MKIKKLAILSAVAGSLWGTAANAQFTYNQGDLLVGFRAPGGSSDLVVDIGAPSLYIGASSPILLTGTYFTTSQLTDAGISLNNMYFSVFGDDSAHDLWASRAGQGSSPWIAHSFSAQGTTFGKINAIANGALDQGSFNSPGPDNTSTAVIVPSSYNFGGSDISYTIGIGANGNFAGTFQGDVENNTAAGFTSGSTPVWLDLYQLNVANNGSAGQLLGQFELAPDGDLTFTAEPTPEPTTWALLGMGGLALVSVHRLRRKNSI